MANRTQTTHIDNDHISSKKNSPRICSRPLLFLTYINDIYLCKLGFYLFGDNTNLLYAYKDLKSLESVVNIELTNVCDWLNANKLPINAKKSNFVVFKPRQKRTNHKTCIRIPDNRNNDDDDDDKGLYFFTDKKYISYLTIFE